MFRKVMQISDELMWEYWELLTNVSLAEIEQMKKQIMEGTLHPMKVKEDLAWGLTKTFHSSDQANAAALEFNKVVRAHEVPSTIETVVLDEGDPLVEVKRPVNGMPHAIIQVHKLIAKYGLAESISDGSRKIKSGAVEFNFNRVTEMVRHVDTPELIVRVGRAWKKFLVPL
jgi:tyrosyl-tRNA synthetase